jgi:hypothetical protein
MRQFISFPTKRIAEIGVFLAEFILDLIPNHEETNNFDEHSYLMAFDVYYEKFLRYAETNKLITMYESSILDENPGGLDGFIKDVAIEAIREMITEQA